IAHHHRLNAGRERAIIARGVRLHQIVLACASLTLVDAVEGAAVSDEMLGGRENGGLAAELALEAADHCLAIAAHKRRIGTIAFVGPAPARVLDDREGRSEGPG